MATTTTMKAVMFYLGSEEKVSGRGHKYLLARFQKLEKPEIISFYVPDQDVKNEIYSLQQFKKYEVILTLSSYNEKPQVDLIGIGGEVD